MLEERRIQFEIARKYRDQVYDCQQRDLLRGSHFVQDCLNSLAHDESRASTPAASRRGSYAFVNAFPQLTTFKGSDTESLVESELSFRINPVAYPKGYDYEPLERIRIAPVAELIDYQKTITERKLIDAGDFDKGKRRPPCFLKDPNSCH